jgi:hypothetical protein
VCVSSTRWQLSIRPLQQIKTPSLSLFLSVKILGENFAMEWVHVCVSSTRWQLSIRLLQQRKPRLFPYDRTLTKALTAECINNLWLELNPKFESDVTLIMALTAPGPHFLCGLLFLFLNLNNNKGVSTRLVKILPWSGYTCACLQHAGSFRFAFYSKENPVSLYFFFLSQS